MRRVQTSLPRRLLGGCLWMAALLCAVQLALGIWGWPSGFMRWLTGADESLAGPPDVVVVLGGGGIPSESGLIRTYYGAEAWHAAPQALCIVALTGDPTDPDSAVSRMKRELVLRGVPSDRIRVEARGRNTREQADGVRELLGPGAVNRAVLVVSSPSHLRRAIACFRAAGFARLGALAAEGVATDADLGGRLELRYGFWNRLSATPQILRELVALLGYRLRGWTR